jgi:hypothetical protein
MSHGKAQEPLTITTIGAKDKHFSSLDDPRCSKPSRSQQTSRVTSEIRSETKSPSASRCNQSSNVLGITPNLTKMMNQMMEMSGRAFAMLTKLLCQ